MKDRLLFYCICTVVFVLTACGRTGVADDSIEDKDKNKAVEVIEAGGTESKTEADGISAGDEKAMNNMDLFPVAGESFVGDPMPFF